MDRAFSSEALRQILSFKEFGHHVWLTAFLKAKINA